MFEQAFPIGGVELAQEKLPLLLKLKSNDAIGDAVADLGQPDQIRAVFVSFQQYFYPQNLSPSASTAAA